MKKALLLVFLMEYKDSIYEAKSDIEELLPNDYKYKGTDIFGRTTVRIPITEPLGNTIDKIENLINLLNDV